MMVAAMAGCASTGSQGNSQQEEKEYRTGSNIPSKNRPDNSGVKSVDQQELRDALNRPAIPPNRNN
jgi:hypothetical protein